MSNIFFTSDNHFFHKNIRKFCPETRKGETVEEMNELMIQKWNDTVSLHDEVYILGDFSFGDDAQTLTILDRLKGRLHLIKGNHDYWITPETRKYFESIQDFRVLKMDKKEISLFHYPIYEWKNMSHGAYHLFGHVHGTEPNRGRSMDVGIDARPQKDMGLWEWSEIKEILEKKEVLSHHGKTSVL